ncbi:MAG: OstA-like protein, partial [Catalinimonas sp.]
MRLSLLLLLSLFIVTALRAQDTTRTPERVELLNAESLEAGVRQEGGQEIRFRKLKGSVRFRHDNATMSCDSAYQYLSSNSIEAFGRVQLNQGDTLFLTGDSLFYDGTTRLAQMRGRQVVLRDQQMTLTTQRLDFDRPAHLAYYFDGGTIIDEGNRLTSDQGYYNTVTQYMRFKDSVRLRSFEPPFQLASDTLEYSRVSKVAYFRAPTRILSDGRVLRAQAGQYNTLTRESDFRGQAEVETADYILRGDTLFYDEVRKLGRARHNVVIISKADTVIIEGDRGFYDGERGFARVHGRALLKTPQAGDTLYVAADTLISLRRRDTLAVAAAASAPDT